MNSSTPRHEHLEKCLRRVPPRMVSITRREKETLGFFHNMARKGMPVVSRETPDWFCGSFRQQGGADCTPHLPGTIDRFHCFTICVVFVHVCHGWTQDETQDGPQMGFDMVFAMREREREQSMLGCGHRRLHQFEARAEARASRLDGSIAAPCAGAAARCVQ